MSVWAAIHDVAVFSMALLWWAESENFFCIYIYANEANAGVKRVVFLFFLISRWFTVYIFLRRKDCTGVCLLEPSVLQKWEMKTEIMKGDMKLQYYWSVLLSLYLLGLQFDSILLFALLAPGQWVKIRRWTMDWPLCAFPVHTITPPPLL